MEGDTDRTAPLSAGLRLSRSPLRLVRAYERERQRRQLPADGDFGSHRAPLVCLWGNVNVGRADDTPHDAPAILEASATEEMIAVAIEADGEARTPTGQGGRAIEAKRRGSPREAFAPTRLDQQG